MATVFIIFKTSCCVNSNRERQVARCHPFFPYCCIFFRYAGIGSVYFGYFCRFWLYLGNRSLRLDDLLVFLSIWTGLICKICSMTINVRRFRDVGLSEWGKEKPTWLGWAVRVLDNVRVFMEPIRGELDNQSRVHRCDMMRSHHLP